MTSSDASRDFPVLPLHGQRLSQGSGINGTTSTQIFHIDAKNLDDLSRAEVLGRKIAFRLAAFMRERVPGFENCYLLRTSPHVGIRETRRVLGDNYLTYDDVVFAQHFDDVECWAGFFINTWPM